MSRLTNSRFIVNASIRSLMVILLIYRVRSNLLAGGGYACIANQTPR
jgi:hypothetical protein